MPPPRSRHRFANGTALLIDTMRRAGCAEGRHVLDVTAGSAVALAAARCAAGSVTTVAAGWPAVAVQRIAALLSGNAVEVVRGDLFAPVTGRRFDLVVGGPVAGHGRRAVDRVCAGAAELLTRDGQVLLVQAARATQDTVDALAEAGFAPAVLARAAVPVRTVPWRRALEELVVVGGIR